MQKVFVAVLLLAAAPAYVHAQASITSLFEADRIEGCSVLRSANNELWLVNGYSKLDRKVIVDTSERKTKVLLFGSPELDGAKVLRYGAGESHGMNCVY